MVSLQLNIDTILKEYFYITKILNINFIYLIPGVHEQGRP